MTEKNIFVYKLFLLINVLDFSLFLCKNTATPPLKKKSPHSPLKIEILSSPSFLKIWLEDDLHQQKGGGGACYDH